MCVYILSEKKKFCCVSRRISDQIQFLSFKGTFGALMILMLLLKYLLVVMFGRNVPVRINKSHSASDALTDFEHDSNDKYIKGVWRIKCHLVIFLLLLLFITLCESQQAVFPQCTLSGSYHT